MGLFRADGVNDNIYFNGASAALQAVPTGNKTYLVVQRRAAAGAWNGLITLETAAGTATTSLEISATNFLDLAEGGTDIVSTATTGPGTNVTDYLMDVAVHSPGGNSGTWTAKNISTGATVAREAMTGSLSLSSTALGANGAVRFGMWQTSDPANAWFVVGAIWNIALTNAQVDECWANKRTSDIWNCSAGHPLVLVEFNTLTPTDLGGNSTYSATNGGPVLDGAETGAGWTFDGTGGGVVGKAQTPRRMPMGV